MQMMQNEKWVHLKSITYNNFAFSIVHYKDANDAICITPLLRGDRGVWQRSLKTRCKCCNAIKIEKCNADDAIDAI